jgi:uncharacterized membrane protein YhaH (DUF805 family)
VYDAYVNFWANFTNFSGRATRSDYWFSFLMHIFVMVIFGFLPVFGGLIVLLYLLVIIIPAVAIGIRRLHDIGKSGLWLFLSLVPLGQIVIIIFACIDSAPDNEYGPNPKGMYF